MQKKYGETVAGIKTKQLVLDYIARTGQKLGAFYDIAVTEKIEREIIAKKSIKLCEQIERDPLFNHIIVDLPSNKPTP